MIRISISLTPSHRTRLELKLAKTGNHIHFLILLIELVGIETYAN